MQADSDEDKTAPIERDVATDLNGDRAASIRFWEDWQKDQIPFLAQQRPWDHSSTVVAGTSVLKLGDDEIAVARDRR